MKNHGKLLIRIPEDSNGFFYLGFEDGTELATVYLPQKLPEAVKVRDAYNKSLQTEELNPAEVENNGDEKTKQ